MANSETVIEIEPAGNTTPLPLLQSTQTHQWGIEQPSWSEPLRHAIYNNDWEVIKEILDNEREAINGPVGQGYDTPLVVALQTYTPLDMNIVTNLINRTEPEKLVYSKEEIGKWRRSVPAIHYAAENGNFKAVKLLITKYPAMLNSIDWYKRTPIQQALKFDRTELASYMLKLGLTLLPDLQEFELTLKSDLEYTIKERNYDFAYILIQQCPKLALDLSPWKILIEECIDLPYRSRLNMLQSVIYPWIRMNDETVLESLTCEWKKANVRLLSETEVQSPKHQYSLVSPLKSIRTLKLKHHQALHLARGLCTELEKFSDEDRGDIVQLVFWLAIHNGMSDIVQIILKAFPSVIEHKDVYKNNALQYAVSHRDGKTFYVVHELIKWGSRHNIRSSVDNKDNNLLHLVAKKARRNRLGTGSEKVLQLQREFQWYKEMENILPSHLKFEKNEEDYVPLEVFDEQHKDMLKSESEWLTSMSNSCMVAGSLIAAVVFAAAITLPGGNDDDNGLPKFAKEPAFQVFAFSDAFALVSSLTTVMTFLSIFITRYSVESFQYDLPNRLIFGLISLFFSVAFLMISFMTTVHLLFAEHYKWITYPTIVVSLGPVLFSSYLQFPSLLNIIKSTYGPNIFHDNNVTVFNKK